MRNCEKCIAIIFWLFRNKADNASIETSASIKEIEADNEGSSSEKQATEKEKVEVTVRMCRAKNSQTLNQS